MSQLPPEIKKPNGKLIYLSIFIFFTIMALLLAYKFSNSPYSDMPDDQPYIVIYGNVKEVVYIPYSTLLDDTFEKETINDFFVQRIFNYYEVDIVGVQIWDIMQTLDLLNDNSTFLIFESPDGYKSVKFPISIMKNDPHCAFLITHEDGKLLEDKKSGGDGPIIGGITQNSIENNQEVIDIFKETYKEDFSYNSAYKVKYMSAIRVI